jgi:hypothetical protein
MNINMATKECRCKDHKGDRNLTLDMFHKDSKRPNGLQVWCKACQAEYDKGRPRSNTKPRGKIITLFTGDFEIAGHIKILKTKTEVSINLNGIKIEVVV